MDRKAFTCVVFTLIFINLKQCNTIKICHPFDKKIDYILDENTDVNARIGEMSLLLGQMDFAKNRDDQENIFPLAYAIKNLSSLYPTLKRLKEVQENLPPAVKTIIFADTTSFWNTDYEDYIYAAEGKYDSQRRMVYHWKPGNLVTFAEWEIIPRDGGAGRYYSIKNSGRNEYLYSPFKIFYGDDHRHIFTWIPGNSINNGAWRFVLDPSGSSVEIWNHNDVENEAYFSEPLFASGINEDNDRGMVYSWVPAVSVSNGFWVPI